MAWWFALATTPLALACVAYAVVHASFEHPGAVVLLSFAAALGVRGEIRLGNIGFATEFVPIVVAAILEPWSAPVVALATIADADWRVQFKALNVSSSVMAATAAAVAASTSGSPWLSAALGTTAYLIVNMAIHGTFFTVTKTMAPRELAAMAVASFLATATLTVPIVGSVAWLGEQFGAMVVPLVLVPLAVTQYFHGLYHRKVQLTDELAEKAQVLARTNLQFAAAMVKALDARDAYTAGHSAAVAVYTRDIAREMGFDDETVRVAHLAGLLHDIGKIGVPGRVLNKTAPLDDEEYELMKSHAAMGAEILGEVDLYEDIAILVRYHHERIDGRGYPDGISGDAIPAISRMISVADTYSAMTTDRPYRDGMPTEKAMSILRECRGTQLDQDFTDAFLRILIVADEAYQRGKQTDFEVEVAKHQALSEVEAEAVRLNEPHPAGPPAPAAPNVPMLPAAVDGELVEVDLEREAA